MKSHTQNFDEYLPEGEKLSPRAEAEQAILKYWQDNGIFKMTVEKPPTQGEYVFYEGPPTANGRPGMHHVEARSFKDLIPRYKTMRGYQVHRKAGWDTHGLPVELQVEKQLGLTSKKQIEEYGIAAFNRACKESVWTYKTEWEAMTTRMGYWVDMDNPYVTYQNGYIEALWGVLKKVDEQGLLYKDFKVLPWCPRCGTALSTHELNQPGAYQDVKDLSVYAKFKLQPGQKIGEFTTDETTCIMAWTTTPWTLPGNVALAVGNDIDYVKVKCHKTVTDPQVAGHVTEVTHLIMSKEFFSKSETKELLSKEYLVVSNEEVKGSDLVGLSYEPLFPYLKTAVENQGGENAEKLAHAYRVYAADFVTTTDGTGVVHIAPMYGADDFDLGTANNLPKFHTVAEDGKFISECDFLAGRYVKEADEKGKPTVAVDIVDYLKENNLWFANENYPHSYPHCWRCDTPLLYYARSSWYIRMSALRDQMVSGNLGDATKPGINWEPENIREGRFGEWLSGIRDWAISRDRYWGTPIPAWETETGKRVVIGSINDFAQYAKRSGNRYFAMRHGHGTHMVDGVYTDKFDQTHHLTEQGIAEVRASAEALRDKGITKIVCSPALRCQQTAKIVAEVLGFDVAYIQTDEAFCEYDFGIYSNKPKKEFDDFFGGYVVAADYMDKVPEGGQSLQDKKVMIGNAWTKLEHEYQNENVLIVTHHAVFEALTQVEKLADKNQSAHISAELNISTAEVHEFTYPVAPHNDDFELDFHKPFIDNVELELDGEKLTRTPEVMDVWFDSGAMPFAQYHELGQPLDTEMSGKFPAQFISEAIDQTRGWFYTLHAVASLMGKPRAYENVICLGHILDAVGKKMSKSKGNVVSPWKMFANYGADTIRMWMYSVNQPGESKNFDEKTVGELENKFFRMLDNCVAFYDMYAQTIDTTDIDPMQSTNVLDQWIIALLNQTATTVTIGLDNYNAFSASRSLREFVPELSQWYVRRSRDRVKDESSMDAKYAVATMKYVYQQFALLMAPFAPFAAEDLYKKMGGQLESVHLESWPIPPTRNATEEHGTTVGTSYEKGAEVLTLMEKTREVISSALELRARAGIKVRQPLGTLTITSTLADDYIELILDEVNVKNVVVGTEPALDTTITDELRTEGALRDIIRALQQLRKEAGLAPGQMATVVASDAVAKFLENYTDEIAKITVTIESGNPENGAAVETEIVSGTMSIEK